MLEFLVQGHALGGVTQDHFRHHLGLRQVQQIAPHGFVPAEKRGFLDELQFGIRVVLEHHLRKSERVQGAPERRLLPFTALHDEGHDPAFLRQGLHDPAGIAVGVTVEDYGFGLEHRATRYEVGASRL